MIKYLSSILSSTNTNNTILKYLLILAIGHAVYVNYMSSDKIYTQQEGFYQKQQFVLKRNDEIYDEFYAEVYDNLHDTKKRCQWELMKLLKYTGLDTRNSVILDIGSGTGYSLNELTAAGYKAYGIDKSKVMATHAETTFPNIEVLCENAEDPMAFEKDIFTHVLCTNFTIYQMKNKELFFRNCYSWMKPNGYLVVHLVDRNRFNLTAPKFGDEIEWKSFYDTPKQRVTKITTDYDDFKYTAGYNFPMNLEETNVVTKMETFKDKETAHVRQNEEVLYMEDLQHILKIAGSCGFIVHAKADMKECNGDENQYLYILERQM
jgi:SAM-dependent methyltransferase